MKLVGKVNGIDRRVAKRQGDELTEKRGFAISLRPATPVDAHYGYGNMNFYLNGRDLDDFPVDLDDEVEVYVCRKGAEAEQHQLEDLRHQLREALAQADTANAARKQFKERYDAAQSRMMEAGQKLQAAAQVNGNLMAQIEALKVGRPDMGGTPAMIEAA